MKAQIEMNRMEFVIALRDPQYPQLECRFRNNPYAGEPEAYCAMGYGLKLFGLFTELAVGREEFWNLQEKLGWERKAPYCGELGNLIKMNDSKGLSFPQIADVLVADYGFPDVYAVKPVREEVAV